MSLRIWLNRTYATNAHVVRMLRENPEDVPVRVFASHTDLDSPVLAHADTRLREPTGLSGADYARHALEVCLEHDISIFWPTWHQHDVANHAEIFAKQGITVMTPNARAVGIFQDKAATYREAAKLGLPIPAHFVVSTVGDFEEACELLIDQGHEKLCFKPVDGVGAEGFRVLSRGQRTFESLAAKTGDHISYAEAVLLLGQRDQFAPLMVMPFLAGGEVSVDVLAYEGTVLSAIPRFKRPGTRAVELSPDPVLEKHSSALVSAFELSYLNNIQFRLDDRDEPWLLEVNTRASGGLFQSCLSGGNLPWAAVQVALRGRSAVVPTPRYPVRLTTYGAAVELPRR